jgi:hypothetical protein
LFELLTPAELHQWAAYFHVKDKQRRIEADTRCVKLLKGISEIMSMDPDREIDLKQLFPEVEFQDGEVSAEEITVESTIAMIANLGGSLPRYGGA